MKAFLQHVIAQRVEPLLQVPQSQGLLESFKQVLVEDSVCVKLNAALFSVFPGSHSPKGKAATARIQLCLNLKTLVYRVYAERIQTARGCARLHVRGIIPLRAVDS